MQRISTNRNDKFESYKKKFIEYDSLIHNSFKNSNYLLTPEIAEICKITLFYPDSKDYKLICFCIMPNHIHLIFKLLNNKKIISKIMMSIKRISAKRSNLILGTRGNFWQAESYDRLVRDDKELFYFINYVLENPVKADFVNDWKDWKNTYCHPDYIP